MPLTASKTNTAPDSGFASEFIETVRQVFEEKIVFNQLLGLKIIHLQPERVSVRLDMRPELIGAYSHKRLHGGVISASLDAVGGLVVMTAIGARHLNESLDQLMHRFTRVATIDMRVDYLRPGIGEHFEIRAEVMRLGSRVASTRMEFWGADGKLLSTGAGAYIVA